MTWFPPSGPISRDTSELRIREPRLAVIPERSSGPVHPRRQKGNVVKELPRKIQNPSLWHKPQQIPQEVILIRQRIGNIPAREGFLAGDQPTQGLNKPGHIEWKQTQE